MRAEFDALQAEWELGGAAGERTAAMQRTLHFLSSQPLHHAHWRMLALRERCLEHAAATLPSLAVNRVKNVCQRRNPLPNRPDPL